MNEQVFAAFFISLYLSFLNYFTFSIDNSGNDCVDFLFYRLSFMMQQDGFCPVVTIFNLRINIVLFHTILIIDFSNTNCCYMSKQTAICRIVFMFTLLVFLSLTSFSQNTFKVSGKVSDETGKPVS